MKSKTMGKNERATATLIIAEVSDILKDKNKDKLKRIEGLLESWVEANDLHPEKVVKIPFGSKSVIFSYEETRRK